MTENRITLITGASRGIGRAAALALAQAGHHVIGTARDLASFGGLQEEIERCGGTAAFHACEMADGAAIANLCAEIESGSGRLDGLFGNAGILGEKQEIAALRPADFEAALTINVTANQRLLHHCDHLLRASPAGRALFVTSGVAWKRHAGWAPYAVTKAALEALASVYANEVAATAVRVNCISPGPIRTEMRAAAWPDEDPEAVPPPEALAPHILHMLSPACTENGMIYDFRSGRFTRNLPPA